MPRSNPVSFNLKSGFTAKDIDRIYDNLRRRARAAFAHQWQTLSEESRENLIGDKLKKNAKAVETALTVAWEQARTLAGMAGTMLEKDRLYNAQKIINDSKAFIRNYEAACFQRVRGARCIKATTTGKKTIFGDAWTPKVRSIINRARSAYPWITTKNLSRLTKAVRPFVIGKDPDIMSGYLPTEMLLSYGIPAVEIAGPWYDKKTFKSPMEWVKYKVQTVSGKHPHFSSPTIREWITANGLDENDRQLRDSIQNYFDGHKSAPSVAWAQRRQSELEQERQEKDIEENAEVVQEWLYASKEWRLRDDVYVPPMPDSSYRIASPMDAHEICRRAAKDGLCVVDRLKDMVETAQGKRGYREGDDENNDEILFNVANDEGVVMLVLLHDKQYRTVVGLNVEGICTSEHHCTGKNNELDKNAWEYFRVAR